MLDSGEDRPSEVSNPEKESFRFIGLTSLHCGTDVVGCRVNGEGLVRLKALGARGIVNHSPLDIEEYHAKSIQSL